MYVYIDSGPGLYTVGFYRPDGQWDPESDHSSKEAAAARVNFLNGSPDKLVNALSKIHDLAGELGRSVDHPHVGAIQAWVHEVLPCAMEKKDGKDGKEVRVQPTPGPWEISDKSPVLIVGYDPRLYPENERVTIAKADPGGDRLDSEIGEANARLIAAAPEMAVLLRTIRESSVLEDCEFGQQPTKDIDRILKSVGEVQLRG